MRHENERAMDLFLEIEGHLLKEDRPSLYLERAWENGAFQEYPFTMLSQMKQTKQSKRYHPEGNVWVHTMLVVDLAAKVKRLSSHPASFVWSALLHDVGKTVTTRIQNGRITSYGHDLEGEAMAKEFFTYFGRPEEFIERVCGLVRYHMYILYLGKMLVGVNLDDMRKRVDSADLALLGLCDRLGRKNQDPCAQVEAVQEFLKRCKELEARGEKREHLRV